MCRHTSSNQIDIHNNSFIQNDGNVALSRDDCAQFTFRPGSEDSQADDGCAGSAVVALCVWCCVFAVL